MIAIAINISFVLLGLVLFIGAHHRSVGILATMCLIGALVVIEIGLIAIGFQIQLIKNNIVLFFAITEEIARCFLIYFLSKKTAFFPVSIEKSDQISKMWVQLGFLGFCFGIIEYGIKLIQWSMLTTNWNCSVEVFPVLCKNSVLLTPILVHMICSISYIFVLDGNYRQSGLVFRSTKLAFAQCFVLAVMFHLLFNALIINNSDNIVEYSRIFAASLLISLAIGMLISLAWRIRQKR